MRHVGDRERHDLGALAGARQPAALDPRQMFPHDVHLANRRARAQQRPVDLLLLRKADTIRRRDPVRRSAAGDQHQQKIVGGRLRRQPQRIVGGFQPGLVGHRVPGLDHPDPPGRHPMAVAGGRDADKFCRIELERVEIVPLRGRRHRGRALAGGKADHPSFRHRSQMRRQHHFGMGGRDRGVEDRAQQRASVGHDDPLGKSFRRSQSL